MAISNYLKRCEYRLGGLKPFVYLIHKNALTVKIKANGVDVHFNHIKEIINDSGETETITPTIYKVEGALCTYSQDENYESKYRFNSNLTLVINELYQEPFFYGLKTLRTNQYYIIIEDKKGIQYLVNPELYTTLNYEYNFTDTNDAQNAVTINWYNLSNFPLLIFSEKVNTDNYLLREQCNYNLGRAFELLMYSHKDLKTNDDTVKITNMYIDDYTKLKKIKYLDETFTLTETYDGNMFRVNLSYSIPLEDNQFNWHYNLLEFKDNRYGAILRTTNDNYVVVGIENGLFPEYKIQTSEDDNTPNMINITFTQLSQYPILYTDEITQYRWIPTDQLCFGFDKYQMLTQQYSDDWGETWETTSPELKKKGEVIEYNSDDCKLSQWVDDGTYCHMEGYNYIKWFTTTEFVCENGNKYKKLRKGISQIPNGGYKLLDEYIKGDLIEENSEECSKIAIRWIDATDGYICFPVNEDLTEWREVPDVTTCVDYGSYKVKREYITNNGSIFYESGEEMVGDLIQLNDYNCGWKTLNVRNNITPKCTSEITDSTVESQNVKLFNVILSNENDSGTLTLQGKGTYQINIHPSLIYDDYKSDFYFMFSQLDTPLKFTGTTSTSTSTTSNYNQCVYYYDYEYGTWSYTINDDEEHTIQYGYLVKNNRNVTVRFVLYDTSPLKVNTKYEKKEIIDVMLLNGELSRVSAGKTLYLPIEYNSCDCGYVGYDWKCGDENGLETICGSAIGYDSTSMYEVWREYEKCEGIETGNVDYRNPKKSCECGYREYEWEWDEKWEDAYICGSDIGLDSTSEYEVWKEYEYCPTIDGYKQYTGKVDYRNPKKTYKCGYITYQWREEENNVCGNALPENTTEVNEAPELNKDFG